MLLFRVRNETFCPLRVRFVSPFAAAYIAELHLTYVWSKPNLLSAAVIKTTSN